MNNQLSKNEIDVYRGREREVHRVFDCLLKSINPNLIVLGEHGVGKTAVVNSVVHHVTKRNCPKELRKYHFIYWDIEKSLAKLTPDDTKISKIHEDFFNFLATYSNLVLVIDQVHLVTSSDLLMYYFSALLKNSNVKIIGVCTAIEFYSYFATQAKIFSMVETITISEPKSKGHSCGVRCVKCLLAEPNQLQVIKVVIFLQGKNGLLIQLVNLQLVYLAATI